jgi:hypothetical protein
MHLECFQVTSIKFVSPHDVLRKPLWLLLSGGLLGLVQNLAPQSPTSSFDFTTSLRHNTRDHFVYAFLFHSNREYQHLNMGLLGGSESAVDPKARDKYLLQGLTAHTPSPTLRP